LHRPSDRLFYLEENYDRAVMDHKGAVPMTADEDDEVSIELTAFKARCLALIAAAPVFWTVG
jgi:hypothetical protein